MSKFSLLLTCILVQTTVLGLDDSFVITTETSDDVESFSTEGGTEIQTEPKIYEIQIDSNITNRFARTLIASKVRNWNNVAQEATFSVILPEKAFISEFVMVIGDKSYKAYVKEKEEARNIYNQALERGSGAAHVAVSARESNRFTVSVNVEALSKATFLLTYEELLKLKENSYELVINIHPNQPVKDLFVNVMINESRPLKFVKTPSIRSGNEIEKREGDLDPRSDIVLINSTSALIKFRPNIERQKEMAGYLGTDVTKGLSGQFVVQYEVERDPNGGEALVSDGYFVHFFAPSGLKPLNKFIIFVLDTSGSMYGQKMAQLKQAMITILEQLGPNDHFHIVGFESNTKVFNIISPENSSKTPKRYGWYGSYAETNSVELTDMPFPRAFPGSSDNIKKAKEVTSNLNSRGGTNIFEALQVALILIEREADSGSHEFLPQPIVMFLTDGQPTTGVSNTDSIITEITSRNRIKVPIYSLSFGDGADKKFLKKLSQQNKGFSRHIYEASDAALQLQNFYKEIASPLLSDVKFEYVPETSSLTKTEFPIHFDGSEIVVSGKLDTPTFPKLPVVRCGTVRGPKLFRPVIETPVTSLERLWAYLTIRQLLDDRETAENKTVNEKKALDLALQYSFVTPVSSLVVVKPNSTDSNVDTEAADILPRPSKYRGGSLASASIARRYHSPSSAVSGSRIYLASSAPRMSQSSSYDSFAPIESRASVPFDSSVPISRRRPVFRFDENEQVSTSSETDKLKDLKVALPWLAQALNDDGTFRSPPGGYELGLNETISHRRRHCFQTPTNTTGNCKLLHACPQVHHLLTSEDTFLQYFCPIIKRFGRFAGVCCP